MNIGANYIDVLQRIYSLAKQNGRNPQDITLVVVCKGHTNEETLIPYQAGCRNFGENRVAELLSKASSSPADIQWHMIGTLQTNKVQKIIGRCALIHSVDSLKLAQHISENSVAADIITPILLQVNTSGEKTKHGLSPEDWKAKYETALFLPGIRIEGLMTIAPYTEDEKFIRSCFAKLRNMRDELKLTHLSMGMSHDYPLAIAEGATLVRVGTAIFNTDEYRFNI